MFGTSINTSAHFTHHYYALANFNKKVQCDLHDMKLFVRQDMNSTFSLTVVPMSMLSFITKPLIDLRG